VSAVTLEREATFAGVKVSLWSTGGAYRGHHVVSLYRRDGTLLRRYGRMSREEARRTFEVVIHALQAVAEEQLADVERLRDRLPRPA